MENYIGKNITTESCPIKKENKNYEDILNKIQELEKIYSRLSDIIYFIKNGYSNEKKEEAQDAVTPKHSLALLLKEGPQMIDYYTGIIMKEIDTLEESLFS